MIAVIRIKGQINLDEDVKETLNRLRVRRKYSCVLVSEKNKELMGMVKKMKDFVAYGEISENLIERLVEKRAQPLDKSKKIDVKKVVQGIIKGEKYEKMGIKPFFRLHPPRGGIDAKIHFGRGKGVLGNNKDKLNELLERML